MRVLMINPRFVNEAGTDLKSGKIHTIRQNYDYWKKFDGQEVSIRVWEGKPYRSKQKEICRKVIGVQKIYFGDHPFWFDNGDEVIELGMLAKNDGFELMSEFFKWFAAYPNGDMVILHFTNFRY